MLTHSMLLGLIFMSASFGFNFMRHPKSADAADVYALICFVLALIYLL